MRVLLADDSAFVRSVLQSILETEPRIEVAGTATNGREAVDAYHRIKPDLVLLDVEMPVMDGLEALTEIRKREHKTPIIMCSTLTQRGVQITIEALARGATDYVSKRGASSMIDTATPSLEEQLVPKILSLFPQNPISPAAVSHCEPALAPSPVASRFLPEIVTIGVSTGGPAALEVLLPHLPADFPLPVLIAQHMPQRFTEQLAKRLDTLCAVPVCEATDRMKPEAGCVYIARGDWHLELTRSFRLSLHQRESAGFCRPSIDLLFHSATVACSGRVLGVILTGMGSDGLAGSRALRAAGGIVLAQDSASSMVWGMPGSVVQAGLANKILNLPQIAEEIIRVASSAARNRACGALKL